MEIRWQRQSRKHDPPSIGKKARREGDTFRILMSNQLVEDMSGPSKR